VALGIKVSLLAAIVDQAAVDRLCRAVAWAGGNETTTTRLAQMSVAEVVLHLAGDSEFGCAALGGVKAPAEPKLTPADSVPKLVARLTRALAFCRTQLAKLNDAGLGDKIPGYDGPTTRAAMIFELHEDWADHYSQLANYLRLNGILPPTARRAN